MFSMCMYTCIFAWKCFVKIVVMDNIRKPRNTYIALFTVYIDKWKWTPVIRIFNRGITYTNEQYTAWHLHNPALFYRAGRNMQILKYPSKYHFELHL